MPTREEEIRAWAAGKFPDGHPNLDEITPRFTTRDVINALDEKSASKHLATSIDAKTRFAALCTDNGLNPTDESYGGPTLMAWLWFNLGLDEVRSAEADK